MYFFKIMKELMTSISRGPSLVLEVLYNIIDIIFIVIAIIFLLDQCVAAGGEVRCRHGDAHQDQEGTHGT